MKPAFGIVIGFALGFGCRYLGIPSPAPPVLFGALLVMAMTLGNAIVDRLLAARAAKAKRNAAASEPGPAAAAVPQHPTGIAA